LPLVFTHGSLQEEAVQVSLYGRVLRCEPDELVDCIRTQIEVPAWHKAAAAGVAYYTNVTFLRGSGGRVAGKVLELTEAELVATDRYEKDADYVRVQVDLASGRRAWVFVSAQTAGSFAVS
jgi:hypothetical protein